MLQRLFDFVASLIGLILLLPLFIVSAILIKVEDGGPVFYRANRVGKGGRLFRVVKFRTMVTRAAELGPPITVENDPRVTSVGRWLRRAKLDELPQLWNVLLGDMTFVGPRPEDPRYVALYTKDQQALLSERPGVTSPASLVYRNEQRMLSGGDWEQRYINEIMRQKLAIELEYASRRTLVTDLGVILKTIAAIFR